jgi:hypothetical protein
MERRNFISEKILSFIKKNGKYSMIKNIISFSKNSIGLGISVIPLPPLDLPNKERIYISMDVIFLDALLDDTDIEYDEEEKEDCENYEDQVHFNYLKDGFGLYIDKSRDIEESTLSDILNTIEKHIEHLSVKK